MRKENYFVLMILIFIITSGCITKDEKKFSKDNSHPVENMNILSEGQIQELKNHWIVTIEELVASSATKEGSSGLARLLGVSEAEFSKILEIAKNQIGKEKAKKLSIPKPGGSTGLIIEDEKKK